MGMRKQELDRLNLFCFVVYSTDQILESGDLHLTSGLLENPPIKFHEYHVVRMSARMSGFCLKLRIRFSQTVLLKQSRIDCTAAVPSNFVSTFCVNFVCYVSFNLLIYKCSESYSNSVNSCTDPSERKLITDPLTSIVILRQ